ncbi:AraC family transcriptional regulator [Mordavella massiliensis]|uniref:AraC family transcriptional regulator n=1 Tax=Mordavella massiliensis TaxID=1871024 RepID=A0A939BEF8_9CLOT|nr:helix-turn-helix domain-containing protein [Mordavella massiliensis]MBM6947062.1 AraC family transcriptional regulator [Mordavella massiliensis]
MPKGFEERLVFNENNSGSFKIFVHEYSSPLHWHRYLEILYILEGRVRVSINGQERIAEPGTLIFINMGEEHYTDFINHEKHKILCIQFDADILYTLGGIGHEMKYISALLNHKIQYPTYIDVREEDYLISILHELLNEAEEKKSGYEMMLKADFYKVIVWYYRKTEEFEADLDRSVEGNQNDEERMKRVFEYVNKNYMYPITTEDAAEYVFLSYSYFCKMFKRYMKITFMEYLNKVRMAQAKKLLIYTNMSIGDIASRTGYRDQNYFTRLFKIWYDMTPSQYRREGVSWERNLHGELWEEGLFPRSLLKE